MHNLLPGTSVANINEKDTADSPTKKNLADIGHLLALHATELGLATNLADMFRGQPSLGRDSVSGNDLRACSFGPD